jgi:hypothetical protein
LGTTEPRALCAALLNFYGGPNVSPHLFPVADNGTAPTHWQCLYLDFALGGGDLKIREQQEWRSEPLPDAPDEGLMACCVEPNGFRHRLNIP